MNTNAQILLCTGLFLAVVTLIGTNTDFKTLSRKGKCEMVVWGVVVFCLFLWGVSE
jgi:hypothetical protein